MKILSGFMIIAGSCGIGFHLSYILSMRIKNLKTILQIILLLRAKIASEGSSLPESFLSIKNKIRDPFSSFLNDLARDMRNGKGESLIEIVEKEIENHLKNIILWKQDLEYIRELGRNIGYLDEKNQLKQLDLMEIEVENAIEQMQKELPEKKKIVQSLGILSGLFLIVLLI